MFHPMLTAPRDGTEIVIKVRGRGLRRVYFLDCQWLSQPFVAAPGVCIDGAANIMSCWRSATGNREDIELDDALGWRPAL